MAKYIDAEMFVCSLDGSECLDTERDYEEIAKRIDEFEAADVEEVRHGEWVRTNVLKTRTGELEYKCSECKRNKIWKKKTQKLPEYCSKCGARMDGGKNGKLS